MYTKDIQPSETGTSFPDNAKLIELAREAGVVGKVPDCINSGKYLAKVTGAAAANKINATPTIKINGNDYEPTTPDALIAAIKQIRELGLTAPIFNGANLYYDRDWRIGCGAYTEKMYFVGLNVEVGRVPVAACGNGPCASGPQMSGRAPLHARAPSAAGNR